MGCASSKQWKIGHGQTPCPPMMTRRSFSMNVHHPPVKKGDSYHVVSLTSSTLGSIKLDPPIDHKNAKSKCDGFESEDNSQNHEAKNKDFEMEMIEVKAWSKMIDEKITRVVPNTPIVTPPGEPETINVNELMDGLDDSSPLRFGPHHHRLRSFSFHVSADSKLHLLDSRRTEGFQQSVKESPKKDEVFSNSNSNSNSKALVSEFDPEVICAFRKALEELSPANPFHLKPRCDVVGDEHEHELIKDVVIQVTTGKLSEDDDEKKMLNGLSVAEEENGDAKKEKVILYFTSLRGVRTTYENCCYVRLILKGLGVRVDERDVSMHSGFKQEMRELLGEHGFKHGLPKVFVGERYIGGIEEIRKMHEDGLLDKVVQHCQRLDEVDVCEACGDIRFVPCETCSGSRKIYYEYDEVEVEDEDEEFEEDEYGFQRCPDCNENGLIRCPICSY